jgi:hypothetical protein
MDPELLRLEHALAKTKAIIRDNEKLLKQSPEPQIDADCHTIIDLDKRKLAHQCAQINLKRIKNGNFVAAEGGFRHDWADDPEKAASELEQLIKVGESDLLASEPLREEIYARVDQRAENKQPIAVSMLTGEEKNSPSRRVDLPKETGTAVGLLAYLLFDGEHLSPSIKNPTEAVRVLCSLCSVDGKTLNPETIRKNADKYLSNKEK